MRYYNWLVVEKKRGWATLAIGLIIFVVLMTWIQFVPISHLYFFIIIGLGLSGFAVIAGISDIQMVRKGFKEYYKDQND